MKEKIFVCVLHHEVHVIGILASSDRWDRSQCFHGSRKRRDHRISSLESGLSRYQPSGLIHKVHFIDFSCQALPKIALGNMFFFILLQQFSLLPYFLTLVIYHYEIMSQNKYFIFNSTFLIIIEFLYISTPLI